MEPFSRPTLSEARTLLHSVALPADDLTDTLLCHFLACREQDTLIAMGGLEIFGEDALLRSLATAPAWQGRGHAGRLVVALEHRAQAAGVTQLYLLTTTAGDYFRRRGYGDAIREHAPPAIARSRQFSQLCPASASFLHKSLVA